ncbi:putative Zn-dependent peptidase [Chitinophaga skermanii]|uniref:Putative Zn-dependent peptidase n=1 Tax=Chitinophaga skermanii TaxID=331697 RepID=A0A327QA43_9BACT|nr:pitrilysin family protein [Chitinophaga skermanii]RAJ01506.1 putative Zn-dependent peptidase [Chitinophaga skermanii]
MLNRSQAPAFKDAVDFDLKLKPYETYTLDNGIPVYVMPSNEQETLQLELVFPSGTWFESQSQEAFATNFLMKNGSSTHSALEINESIEYYGAYINRSVHHEWGSYVMHSLSKHIESLMPVLQEVVLDPAFSEEELLTFKQIFKQKLTVSLQKCDFVANRYIDQYLFGSFHPYGRVSSMEAYDALQSETLRAFYKKHYTYNNCKIFVAGHLPANFQQLLNHYFGTTKWNGESTIQRLDLPIQPADEKIYRISNDENGVQGAIRIARPMPNRYHPDFMKLRFMNTIFGGYFGSRLMSNIREEKGYTYGIHSQLYNFRQVGALNITTEAGRDVCEATITEVYNEMARMQNELVDEEELSLVRNYMLGLTLGDLDGAFQVIQRWKSLILNDLDENYFYQNIETIKTISAKDIQRLAQQYLNKTDFYELVVV